MWSLARAHRLQGRQGHQGHQAGRTGLAGVADRHSHAAAAAGRTVVDRAVVDRTVGLGRSIAGAAQLVGRASGYDWRHSSDRIGRGGRRSLADAAELGRTDRAQVLGMDSACVLAVAHALYLARLLCTHLLLRVRTVALAVLVVLRLAVGRRRRVLLLLVVAAAAVALLLLVCAVVALAMALLAAVVVVARHGEYVWSRDV